jgi:large repetitive protein
MVPTGFDVTVTNMSSGCTNTLRGGLVITPCAADGDLTCTAGPLQPGTCSAVPNPALTNQAVTFTSIPSGGTGTYTYSWNFGDASPVDTNNPATHTYVAAGNFPARVNITDTGNGQTASCAIAMVVGLPVPVVTSLLPTTGPAAGGTAVTITGTGFTGATLVTFAGVAATNMVVVNATTITCTTPAGTAATNAPVVVTTPGGVSNNTVTFGYV